MKIKITMSIQNAPFENIQPEIEIDTDNWEEGLKQIDFLYRELHNRHFGEGPKGE